LVETYLQHSVRDIRRLSSSVTSSPVSVSFSLFKLRARDSLERLRMFRDRAQSSSFCPTRIACWVVTLLITALRPELGSPPADDSGGQGHELGNLGPPITWIPTSRPPSYHTRPTSVRSAHNAVNEVEAARSSSEEDSMDPHTEFLRGIEPDYNRDSVVIPHRRSNSFTRRA
jgi:hypothetical protein